MAGRPLHAELKENLDGTFSMRVPVSQGSSQRRSINFPNHEQGERFRAAFLAAWTSGLALPEAEHYQSLRRQRDRATSDSFPDVAIAWWKKFYSDDNENPETAHSVGHKINNHLIPFFAPRVDHIGDITYADCEDFVEFKAGKWSQPTLGGVVVAEARDFTLAQAAQWSKRAKSTVRKAWLTNRLPNAYLDTSTNVRGVVKVPVGDLIAAGLVPRDPARDVPVGYSRKHVNEMLSILRRIFVYARANGLMVTDPSEGIKAKNPAKGAKTRKSGSQSPKFLFDLTTSKAVASHLHIQHQLAFWLMRGAGLRISEAYGVDLGDISRDEGRMILRIWQQGGKKFKVQGDDGTTIKVDKKTRTKTTASTRTIPLPAPLAELIEVYIAAFHDDSAPDTPLLKPARGLGQSSFRYALQTANELEGHGERDVGFRASPHVQRAFFTTDMDSCPPRARSIYLGHMIQNHEGGAAITEAVYTLRRQGVKQLLVVADAMGDLIKKEIGTLVDPTPARRLIPAQLLSHPTAWQHALNALESAELICSAVADGDEFIDVREASEMLAVSVRQTRKLARAGLLRRHFVPGAGRTSSLAVGLSSVEERLVADQELTTRRELLSEFGLTYRELDVLIAKLGVKPVLSSTVGHRYDADQVELIREHFKGREALSNRAVSVTAACAEIGCTRRTVSRLLSLGHLKLEARATADLGQKMITRQSLDELIKNRTRKATLPHVRPAGSIPIFDAQQRTGLSRVQVLELKAHGVIVHRTPDYQFHIYEVSLSSYLKERP